jgi:hypothetical protein
MKTKIIIAVLLVFIFTGIVVGYYYKQKNNQIIFDKKLQDDKQRNLEAAKEEKTTEIIQTFVPERIELGNNIPTEFPAELSVEKDAKIEQSYELNYGDQKQFSIVFISNKSVGENFIFYSKLLSEKGWDIVNKNENEKAASFYAIKDKDNINITINKDDVENSKKSQVSISFLKK